MATMIPEKIAQDVQSNAERTIFRRIQEELGDDWIALHSLGLARHPRNPWAEGSQLSGIRQPESAFASHSDQ